MNKLFCSVIFSGLLLTPSLRASFFPAVPLNRQIETATAVFRGEVTALHSYQNTNDGRIYTRAVIRVDETFKGKLPPFVKVSHLGGIVGRHGEANDFSPLLRKGEELLFFVSRRADGTLYATHGTFSALELAASPANQTILSKVRDLSAGGIASGGDVTDQAATDDGTASPDGASPDDGTQPSSSATNLISGTNTVGPRFLQQDRGELIPYLIDVQYLPTNIPQNQAIGAVQSAIAAWTAATSLRFQYAGLQNFGMAAADVNAGDGVLRIQLHDHYSYTGNGVGDGVAVGGQGYNSSYISSGWATGGNVIGNDFFQTTSPWVIVQTTNEVFFTISSLASCMAHEIGHALGLAHSSNDPNETNALLYEAIMYFELHTDGRGAQLNQWDTNTMRQLYPPLNTPPYAYNRMMDIVTTPNPINIPGINQVQIPGFDLQTASSNLVFQTSAASSINGTFSTTNNVIIYTPAAFFGDSGRLDPSGNSFYDIDYARYSDGTNASPFVQIKVLSYNADSYSEGIPDSWRNTYFGSPDPSAGPNRHATNDFDGDGYSNLQEWIFGSDPTDPTSNLRITSFNPTNLQWQVKGYELYELYTSTNFKNWTLAVNPLTPTNTPGVATNFTNGGPNQFFRIEKVP